MNIWERRALWLWVVVCFLAWASSAYAGSATFRMRVTTTGTGSAGYVQYQTRVNGGGWSTPAVNQELGTFSTATTTSYTSGNTLSYSDGATVEVRVRLQSAARSDVQITATCNAASTGSGTYDITATIVLAANTTLASITSVDVTGTQTACAPPPTFSKYSWAQEVCNTSGFVQRYRFGIDYATGTDYSETFSLQPGQCRDLTVENTVSFIPSLEVENVLSDGQGTAWVPTELDDPVETSESTEPPAVNTGTTANGNIWTDTDAPNRLGTQPPITGNTETRTDTSASTGDTLNRQRESNDEKRHAELKSLLIAADSAEAKRDTVQLDAFNAGISRLQAQTAVSGAATTAAVNALKSSLEAGSGGAGDTLDGAAVGTGLQGSSTTGGTVLGGLMPSVTMPAGVAPVITLPLASVHESLEDYEWDFGSDELEPIVTTVRALELVGLTVWFLYLSFKAIGRAGNV